MNIKPFHTERFFALHEFTAPYILCASDCESLTVGELLQLAGASWQSLGRLRLGYTESQGAPALRERIADLYTGVNAGQVIGLAAPEEGIFLTMHALLEPGDEVIVLTPCYDSLANVAQYLDCRVARWPLLEADEPPDGPGGWRLDLDALERLVTPRTKLVIVNFPHNPTGYLPSHDEWQTIVQIVERAGAWLFSDEMYRGLEYDPTARLPSGCDLYQRAITLAGLSKTHGLPGLRAGWLALQDTSLRDRILGWKDYTTICASAPAEALAQTALQVGDLLAQRSQRIIQDNLALAEPFFARWRAVFRWNRPQAGSVALVGLRGQSARDFSDRLVTEQGVLLLPGTCLGSDDRHLRFGLGRLNFRDGLEQLDRYLCSKSAPLNCLASNILMTVMTDDSPQPSSPCLPTSLPPRHPLAQVRVLDLSRLLPGPYCSRILADFGAEVIKVERPGGGDWLRYAPPLVNGENALFRTLNRGKKSLTLNLKTGAGQAIFLRLVETADALLESFRPGVMERLGLGYETLAQANPRLVYCSLSGYGSEGPHRQRAGHDLNYIGLAGLLDLTGPREGPLAIPGALVADLAGALWAAIGILLALLARERTGRGQRVNGSLLGAALACMPVAVARHLGSQPMERGGSDLTGGLICYHVYETRDGGYITLAALEPEFWAAFCRAAGYEHLLAQQFAPAIPGEPAYEELCACFRARTRQEWAETLAGLDTCCEPVYTLGEALASAPVRALKMVTGEGLLPPVRLSDQTPPPPSPSPALGQHTTALLAKLGYDPAEMESLRGQGVV